MKDILTRNDISDLVNAFYGKARKDDLLGPIFNGQIPDHEWPAHLEKIIDFWDRNLLGNMKYKGSPTTAHARVDEKTGHSLSQVHFHRWLSLWLETVDEGFAGTIAERAKAGARKFATGQFIAILKYRPKN